jgi:PAS domain-containing protein
VLHDITERRQAEEQLRESEERFRRLANAAQEGIIIQQGGHHPGGQRGGCRMFGVGSTRRSEERTRFSGAWSVTPP